MPKDYLPLAETLRLYAGWLLACLGAIYGLGTYAEIRPLPMKSDLLHEWVTSPLILQVTFLTFIFLLLSGFHRIAGRGIWSGLALTAVGFLLIALFMANT